MRRYETVTIFAPDISEGQLNPALERVQSIIDAGGGYLVEAEDWGVRKLAYPIRKKSRGRYFCINYCGNGAIVDEIERFFRIDDRLLKFMTILLDEKADIETIKKEQAEKAKIEAAAEEETGEAAGAEEVETNVSGEETPPADAADPAGEETPPADAGDAADASSEPADDAQPATEEN